MMKKILLSIAVASTLTMMTGCGVFVNTGEDQTSKISIDKDNADQLDVKLNIGAGELTLEKGTKEWVEGTIDYNDEKLKPTVSYELKDGVGVAVIENMKNVSDINVGDIKNEWMLQLNDTIPVNLTINSGASETTMDLKGVNLNKLDVNAGVGDVTIDLGGDWTKSFDAEIKMGVGKSTIILPTDIGVRIKSTKGIGKAEFVGLISKGNGVYVNEAYEDADVVIEIDTDLGIGKTVFKLED